MQLKVLTALALAALIKATPLDLPGLPTLPLPSLPLPTILPTILPTVLPTILPTILPTLPPIIPELPPLIPASDCSTGPIQCCTSLQSPNSLGLETLLASLGINVAEITGIVGVTCSPLSVGGVPGNSCSSQPVCCADNTFNGIVAIGCTPVDVNL